jgi:hypothetical protein
VSSIITIAEREPLVGEMRVWERTAEPRGLWRPVGRFKNILLNQWYLDLYGQLQPSPPGGIVLSPANLALGYGVTPTFLRPDTGLKAEWSTAVGTGPGNLGTSAITTVPVTAIPIPLANGVTVVLDGAGADQNMTVNPGEAAGATQVRVNSFSPNTGNGTGAYAVRYTDTSIWVPQRMTIILGSTNSSDPVSGTWSFYLPASANTVALTFTEAGLVYQSNTKFMSHVAFAYTKSGNTDLRIDYVLTRTTT